MKAKEESSDSVIRASKFAAWGALNDASLKTGIFTDFIPTQLVYHYQSLSPTWNLKNSCSAFNVNISAPGYFWKFQALTSQIDTYSIHKISPPQLNLYCFFCTSPLHHSPSSDKFDFKLSSIFIKPASIFLYFSASKPSQCSQWAFNKSWVTEIGVFRDWHLQLIKSPIILLIPLVYFPFNFFQIYYLNSNLRKLWNDSAWELKRPD